MEPLTLLNPDAELLASFNARGNDMDKTTIKAQLVAAAAVLAAGVISNLPDQLKSDPEIANPDTQAENTMAYRLCHVFYDGLCRALDPSNPKGWQTADWLKDAAPTPAPPSAGLSKLED